MGEQHIDGAAGGEALRAFTARLLRDIRAFEAMARGGRLEAGVHRIGAEQEAFLVDAPFRAAPVSAAVLGKLAGHPCFVPELGTFQVEVNLDPLRLGGACLGSLHAQLDARVAQLREAARAVGVDVVLTGVLPTLRRRDVTLANLTARPRYAALNAAVQRLRGAELDFKIEGTDELIVREGSVMLEAATASFQVHLQVGVDEFAAMYNAAQAIAGAQLAAGSNSPLLFGQRLWSETRIPLFQQAADTRTPTRDCARERPRVVFGSRWVRESPAELFREDFARYPVLIVAGTDADEDPFATLARGAAPDLAALRVHTSTVYRWNRLCYGARDGAAHIRIENRVLPSGPTTLDEVANAALWLGLLFGVVAEYGDVAGRMAFDDAKANFFAAARAGLGAHLAWVDGEHYPAQALLRERLIPLAREGLRAQGVAADDVERYLGVVAARVGAARTGSQWILASDAALREGGTRGEQLAALTAAIVARQREGAPVHEWPLARLEEAGGPGAVWDEVEQVMATDVATVREEDAVALAEATMEWQGLEHVPVEDARGALVGLVSRAALAGESPRDPTRPVAEVMCREPVQVAPETPTTDALAAMRARGVDCVLVVHDGRLVGLVTASTLAACAARTTYPGDAPRVSTPGGDRASAAPPRRSIPSAIPPRADAGCAPREAPPPQDEGPASPAREP